MNGVSRGYWRRRPWRVVACLLAVVLAVACGVAAVLVASSLVRGHAALTRDLLGGAALQAVAADGSMTAAWRAPLEALPEVRSAAPVLLRQGVVVGGGEQFLVRVRGVRADHPNLAAFELLAGEDAPLGDASGVLIGDALAERLGLAPGGVLEMITPRGLRRYPVRGVYRGTRQGALAEAVIAPLYRVQADFAGGEAVVSWFDLVPQGEVAAAQQAAQARLGGAASVLRAAERRATPLQAVTGVAGLLGMSAFLGVLAALYFLMSALSLTVLERAPDLRRLHALGLSAARLHRWLLREVALLVAVGLPLGLVVGWGGAQLLAGMATGSLIAMTPLWPASIALSWLAAASGGLTGLLLVAALGLTLARRLRAVTGAVDARPRRTWAAGAGLGCTGFGALALAPSVAADAHLALLQTVGVLIVVAGTALALPAALTGAADCAGRWRRAPAWLWLSCRVLRDYRRHGGVAVASLMAALALFTGVFSVVHSYRTSLESWLAGLYDVDLVVTQHSLGLRAEVPIREGLPWRMAVIPSVALVAPASAEVPPQGRQRRIGAALYIFDAEAQAGRSPLGGLAGVAEARVAEALREGRNVAVSRALAAAGDLRVGDSLTLATAAGSRDYRIAAVVPDNRTAQSSLFMDRRLYLSDWRGEHVSLYTVALEQTAEPERVAALLQRALEGRYAAKVMSVSEYRAEIRKAVRDTFGFTQLLAAIIVLIAVGGLINAGLESLFALRRDLATLRALGVRARFLKAMLFAEIALQGGVAVVAGTLLGSLLSAVLLRGVQVWGHLPLPWQPPAAAYALPLGIAVALTALVALLLLRTVPPKLSGRPFGG